MKRKQFGVVLVCLLGAAAVANLRAWGADKRIKGSGNTKKVSRAVSNIRSVAVHGVGTLIVEVGNTEGLTIEADDNVLPFLAAKQNGGTWEVGPIQDISLEPQTPIMYRLRVKYLDALTLSGSTRAELPALPPVRDFAVSLSGATAAQFARINTDTLKVNASGASRIDIKAGKAKRQMIQLSGASHYRAFDLSSETTMVQGSGTSSVEITATRELKVDASGVTQVRYKGSPTIVKLDTSGVSSVKASQ